MQIADCAGCCGVDAVNFAGEYTCQIGEYGSEWLSQDFQ